MFQILKRFASRTTLVLATALFLPGLAAELSAVQANPVVVIDVDSGKVLFSEEATVPWYPASITKLMTAYVALKAVRDGRTRMDSLLTVSKNSAALPPSKMGFKPGSQIRLDNALKIIMVKSANDIANTIAEGVGGDTESFVAMMNRSAQYLGMVDTRFANPHGLPDQRQQTSARDMAILGRTLLLEFPEYNDLFHIGAIQFGKRVMYNTNGLIGRYPGADGMKTGFICAAGFNVVASATRGGRQLLAVVLGAPSANERTLLTASLFDKGFSSGGFLSPTLESLPASNVVTPPNLRSQICEKRGALSEDEDGSLSASTSGNSDSGIASFFGTSAMAYAETESGKIKLGPRAKAIPQMVWLGLNPPSSAEQAANDEPVTKPLKGKPGSRQKVAVQPKATKATGAKTDTGSRPAATKASTAQPKVTHIKPPPPVRPALPAE